jgi:hypothetical protein
MNRPGLAASNYILNIVELQNTITSASGATPFNVLSNQVAEIRQMVDFGQKQVNANVLSAFDAGGAIQVISPLNLSNTTLSVDGAIVIGGGSIGMSTTTIGTASTMLSVSDGPAALAFKHTAAGLPSSFIIYSTGNAVFASSVTATAFITASDQRLKQSLRPITDYETILSQITGYRFQWLNTGAADIGVIAQDVAEALPEAVATNGSYLMVAYDKLVPVLLEAVKGLNARVKALEALTPSAKSPKESENASPRL